MLMILPLTQWTQKWNLYYTLWRQSLTLIKWFNEKYLKLNADKCHLFFSKHYKGIHIKVEEEVIKCSDSVKLLRVTIDNNLNIKYCVSNLSRKANQKRHALARIANFMSKEKLRILMKAFIESPFGYCPLTWMFHSRTLNNRINKLYE